MLMMVLRRICSIRLSMTPEFISYRSSRPPPFITAGRMVSVDGLGGVHRVLIQYARLRLPGDLGSGARTRKSLSVQSLLGPVCRLGHLIS